jgi:hypothetical protein
MARASASYDHEEIQEARSLLLKAMEVAGKKVLTSDEVRKKLPELKRILIMYGRHSVLDGEVLSQTGIRTGLGSLANRTTRRFVWKSADYWRRSS